MAKNNIIRVGDVEIVALSDGMLEFDLCNFFPTIPGEQWQPHGAHLTDEHKVRFNLGSYLIRSSGRTILVDTGLGPRPAETPDVPWGELLRDFQANGVRPDEVDMVVMTHLHRDHVGWNLLREGERWVPTFPRAKYWMSQTDWDTSHQPDVQPQRYPNAPTCVWPLQDLGLIEFMHGEHSITRELTDARPHARARQHPRHLAGPARARPRRRRPQPGAVRGAGLGLSRRHGPRADASDAQGAARPAGA